MSISISFWLAPNQHHQIRTYWITKSSPVTGYTGSCQYDNFLCRHLRQSLQNDDIFVLVLASGYGVLCVGWRTGCRGKGFCSVTLQWRHNGRDGASNRLPYDCLLNRLFRRRSKKTSNLGVTGLCVGNSPVTGEFPTQRASNAENVSIWWRHHVIHLYGSTVYTQHMFCCSSMEFTILAIAYGFQRRTLKFWYLYTSFRT